jgi:hypothetical protein
MGFPIAAEIAHVAFIASSYTSLPLQAFSSGITDVWKALLRFYS